MAWPSRPLRGALACARLSACAFTLLTLLLARSAAAHATATSSVSLSIDRGRVDADLQLPLDQLGYALHEALDDPTLVLPARVAELRGYLLQHIALYDAAGSSYDADVGPLGIARIEGVPYLTAHLVLTAGAGALIGGALTWHDDAILHQVVTHHILVSVQRDFEEGLLDRALRDPKMVGVLTYAQKEVTLPREGASALRGILAVVRLGALHIAEGTDHLLFLLVLLLPAPLQVSRPSAGRARWPRRGEGPAPQALRGIVGLVTAFTVGHSISLAAAALGGVVMPLRPVEVLVALSILVTAVHAVWPLFPRREALVALGFGIVHGLAFATALADLGFRGRSLALSLLGFNLGIEAMQLAVVAVVAPVLIVASRSGAYPAIRIGGAACASVAAAGWVVARAHATAQGNAITRRLNVLAEHPALALVGLVSAVLLVAVAAPLGGRVAPFVTRRGLPRPRPGTPGYGS